MKQGFSFQVKDLGQAEYESVWRDMQAFTNERKADDEDQVWLVEHNPVFTLGQAGKEEHLLAPGNIPVFKTDRGGQVTYHGPGQIVLYPLLDLRRRKLGVRSLVTLLECTVVKLLTDYGVDAAAKPDAPGVYVSGKKIASLGLRVRRGCSFHGLSFNADMDLEPFGRINPCGYNGLLMTQLKELVPQALSINEVKKQLLAHFAHQLEQEL